MRAFAAFLSVACVDATGSFKWGAPRRDLACGVNVGDCLGNADYPYCQSDSTCGTDSNGALHDFTGHVFPSVDCYYGFATQIDDSGLADPFNLQDCKPQSQKAFLEGCNDDSGGIVITVVFERAFIDYWNNNQQMQSFTYNSTHAKRVLQYDDTAIQQTVSDDSLTLYLTVAVTLGEQLDAQAQVQVRPLYNLDFKCSYALGMLEVSTDVEVTGNFNVVQSRSMSGTLNFQMTIPDANQEVGKPVGVEIVPLAPGLVKSRIKHCWVELDANTKYTIYGDENGAHYCPNPFVQFDGMVDDGDGSQSLSFTAFKWDTTADTQETQDLKCTMMVSFTDFPPIDRTDCPTS